MESVGNKKKDYAYATPKIENVLDIFLSFIKHQQVIVFFFCDRTLLIKIYYRQMSVNTTTTVTDERPLMELIHRPSMLDLIDNSTLTSFPDPEIIKNQINKTKSTPLMNSYESEHGRSIVSNSIISIAPNFSNVHTPFSSVDNGYDYKINNSNVSEDETSMGETIRIDDTTMQSNGDSTDFMNFRELRIFHEEENKFEKVIQRLRRVERNDLKIRQSIGDFRPFIQKETIWVRLRKFFKFDNL